MWWLKEEKESEMRHTLLCRAAREFDNGSQPGQRTLEGGSPDEDEKGDGFSFMHEWVLKGPMAINVEMSNRHSRYQKISGLQR